MSFTTITDKLTYTGKVDISVQLHTGQIYELKTHNEGLPYVSEFFAKTMLGYDMRPNIPSNCIMEQYKSDTWVNITKQGGIPVTSKTFMKIDVNDPNSMFQINYNILFTYNYLDNSKADFASDGKCRIVLRNSSLNEFARVELVTDNVSLKLSDIVGEDKNGIINWRLSLCNPATNNDMILNLNG